MDTPTIWIVNEAGHEYDKALELIPGAILNFLSIGSINPLAFDRMMDTFAQGVVKYVKPGDYLLISGTPPANAVVFLLWILHFDECQILLWDAKLRKYKLVTPTMEQVKNIMQRHMDRSSHG